MKTDRMMKFKRKIISSQLFWKFRHYFQPSWVNAYNDKKISDFYLEFLKKNKSSSVFDFGCATGNLLFNLNQSFPDLVLLGLDINSRAINECNQKFNAINKNRNKFMFINKIDHKSMKAFLDANALKKFDVTIFDRVLYCLRDNEINKILSYISDFTTAIIIDDFVIDNKKEINGYKHRDWIKKMSDLKFENIYNSETIYTKVDKANARTLVFRSIN